MVTLIKRILGYLGFTYCKDCGRKLEEHPRGYYDVYYLCPHCDHLERFDTSGLDELLEEGHAAKYASVVTAGRAEALERLDRNSTRDFLEPVTKEAKKHMDEVHKTKGRPKEECEYCGKEYKGLRGLKIHQSRVHKDERTNNND